MLVKLIREQSGEQFSHIFCQHNNLIFSPQNFIPPNHLEHIGKQRDHTSVWRNVKTFHTSITHSVPLFRPSVAEHLEVQLVNFEQGPRHVFRQCAEKFTHFPLGIVALRQGRVFVPFTGQNILEKIGQKAMHVTLELYILSYLQPHGFKGWQKLGKCLHLVKNQLYLSLDAELPDRYIFAKKGLHQAFSFKKVTIFLCLNLVSLHQVPTCQFIARTMKSMSLWNVSRWPMMSKSRVQKGQHPHWDWK